MRVQCDEIWSFCHAKAKNVPDHLKGEFGYGDVWTWVGIDADIKLAVSWIIGRRDLDTAKYFMDDLAFRLSNRVQLSTDGHKAYLEAVEGAFGDEIDYAMILKIYGPSLDPAGRYSPSECIGQEKKRILGMTEMEKVSTSYIERQNLTMRMGMRRFTRLTNGFSKKVENLGASISLPFMHYNFCRVHYDFARDTGHGSGYH
jgi:IS1 family transposase